MTDPEQALRVALGAAGVVLMVHAGILIWRSRRERLRITVNAEIREYVEMAHRALEEAEDTTSLLFCAVTIREMLKTRRLMKYMDAESYQQVRGLHKTLKLRIKDIEIPPEYETTT